jgi:hypothetical protein
VKYIIKRKHCRAKHFIPLKEERTIQKSKKAIQEKTMHTSFENQKQQKTLGPKINSIMTKEKQKVARE